MADRGSVRQRIIASVFTRRNAQGSLAESYVNHLKIWEDAEGGRKPRYILLSQAANGTGYIHKSKLNTNGSFSVGKTWNLSELKGVSVLNPMAFDITMARTYHWQTESEADQISFIDDLIKLFRTIAGGAPLQLQGVSEAPLRRQPSEATYLRASSISTASSITQTPSTGRTRPPQSQVQPQPERHSDHYATSIPAVLQPRGAAASRPRPSSPATTSIPHAPETPRSRPVRSRPPSPPRPAANATPSIPRSQYNNAPDTPSQLLAVNARSASPSLAPPQIPQRANRSNGKPTGPIAETRSPAPSNRSRGVSPVPSARSAQAIPSKPEQIPESSVPQYRPPPTTRVSFFDPSNQAMLDRLIMSDQIDNDGEEETAQATMASVEEMLEGYEWASDDIIGQSIVKGTADLIEARLLDELMALEKANIHSFLESDDRIGTVLKFMDEAISELDAMESLVSSYKIHLNAVSDDISHIQSQNRGLQVQTQNQKMLLDEIQKLLQTTHVDRESLIILTQESLEKPAGIVRLEGAAAQLYKALQAGRNHEMAATMERLEEYKTHNHRFSERIYRYLEIAFPYQSTMLLNGTDNGIKKERPGRATIIDHKELEDILGRYSGLMLYLKEMDEGFYAKVCVAYFSATSELHIQQMRALMSFYQTMIIRSQDEESEISSFAGGSSTSASLRPVVGIRRAGTIIKSPIDSRKDRDKDKRSHNELHASEAFSLILEQTANQVFKENEFIADFLQINDATFTYADYMGLDHYFRRQATRTSGLSQSTMKLVRGAMDLIFGFLPTELKAWLDTALAKDPMYIIGILASLERFISEIQGRGSGFFLDLLTKQHLRLKGMFERHVNEQIKAVEQTKVNNKKRRGVAPFIKYFPVYVARVESQLIGAENLEIRIGVDNAYDRIVQCMFGSLKQMAMEDEEEDKGQLNYHVILIENMHHFVAEIAGLDIGSVANFVRKAESLYEENLNAYVKIVLRRPFSKIIDFFEGVERLLKTTAPTEIASISSHSKSALKKVIKEYNAKDIRKIVDGLFRRVEKHFDEASETRTTEESGGIIPGTVMVGVWKALEEEVLRITELFSKRVAQCYGGSGVSLEYSVQDVTVAFRRQQA